MIFTPIYNAYLTDKIIVGSNSSSIMPINIPIFIVTKNMFEIVEIEGLEVITFYIFCQIETFSFNNTYVEHIFIHCKDTHEEIG